MERLFTDNEIASLMARAAELSTEEFWTNFQRLTGASNVLNTYIFSETRLAHPTVKNQQSILENIAILQSNNLGQALQAIILRHT